jgi:hypothetical protein
VGRWGSGERSINGSAGAHPRAAQCASASTTAAARNQCHRSLHPHVHDANHGRSQILAVTEAKPVAPVCRSTVRGPRSDCRETRAAESRVSMRTCTASPHRHDPSGLSHMERSFTQNDTPPPTNNQLRLRLATSMHFACRPREKIAIYRTGLSISNVCAGDLGPHGTDQAVDTRPMWPSRTCAIFAAVPASSRPSKHS